MAFDWKGPFVDGYRSEGDARSSGVDVIDLSRRSTIRRSSSG